MRVGVSDGPTPFDPDQVDERVAAKIHELGFSGVATHFGYGLGVAPADLTTARCRRARDVLAAYGIRIVQAWGWSANLIHPDPAERRRQVALLGAAARVAADLGAAMVIVGSGSHNPRGPYWPHRDNHAPDTQERLVASLREAASAAEHHGVVITLEGHVLTTLDTPERVRDIVQAVGSPAVRVNLDPVNFVGDLPTLYASTQLLTHVFEVLGDMVVSGHVKDVYAEDRLVLHLSETVLGDGEFDLRTYLTLFEKRLPDAYLFIEHLPEELVARAKGAFDDLAGELGIRYRGA